jgi:multidrug efflux system membrane fusion protein
MAVAVPLFACAHSEPYEKPLTPVKVETVGLATGAGGVRYSAAIEPKTRVDLAFKVPGYIGDIATARGADGQMRLLQEGDHVRQGMTLARIRQGDFEVKVREARSQLSEAEAALTHATAAFERATALLARKSIARPDYEAARAAHESVQAKVQGARALVQEAENAVADSSLRSPIDGVILKRLIEVGSLVGPGTPGFVLADISSVKVVYGAPDVLLRTLKVGTPQTVTTEAVPGVQFAGRVTKVSPMADLTSRVFDVEITIPNPADRLKIGMVAALEVGDAAPPAVVVVPLAAIIRSKTNPQGYAVFVAETRGDKTVVQLRDVTVGEMYGNRIAVTSGLKPGDRVVTSGATIVVDGETVTLAV